MRHIKLFEGFLLEMEIPTKPFFIEATEETIDDKLIQAGIKGGKKLQPPYVGVTADGMIWEMFRHTAGSKKGWMIHPTGRRIKKELISKYINESHKSTEDMSFEEIKKAKADLTRTGGFTMYVGKEDKITSMLRSLSSFTSPWVEKISDTQIKVYSTPDEDAKHEIEDMASEFTLQRMDLNSKQ